MTFANKQTDKDDPAKGVESRAGKTAELREGIDYYLEAGLLVFTAEFLRRRGYCCDSGCRHCPYQDRKE